MQLDTASPLHYPCRADTRLLSNYQHQGEGGGPSLTQTELYTAYAARFSSLLPENSGEQDQSVDQSIDHSVDQSGEQSVDPSVEQGVDLSGLGEVEHAELKDFEANMGMEGDMFLSQEGHEGEQEPPQEEEQEEERPPPRMLNPVELIALARMTFPKCEPAVDEDGRFVVRGLERREGVEKGRGVKAADMFPFALASGECSTVPSVSASSPTPCPAVPSP